MIEYASAGTIEYPLSSLLDILNQLGVSEFLWLKFPVGNLNMNV